MLESLKEKFMKKTILVFLFFVFANIGADTPKLLLHFDINKTIIAEDLTAGKSLDMVISSLLAEKCIQQWDLDHSPMSFYDYVHTVLVPGPTTPTIKQQRNEILAWFVYMVLNDSDFPNRDQILKTYFQVTRKMGGQYLIPSFVKLITHLQEQNIDFKIILRTFGGDLRVGKVTQEIDELLSDSHFTYWGKMKERQLFLEDGTHLSSLKDIHRFFMDATGHIAIQDSWEDWSRDSERGRSGKPFMFDPNDLTTLSLFFDDNINPDPSSEYNIVAPMDLEGNLLDLAPLLGHQIFVVDTLQAILDENDDYYIQLVDEALGVIKK
jgi:hypothetical protein